MDRPASLRPGGSDGNNTHACWDVFAYAEGAFWQLDDTAKARVHSILVIAPVKPPIKDGKLVSARAVVYWPGKDPVTVDVNWPGTYLAVPVDGFTAVVDADDVGLRVFVDQALIPKAA